MTITVELPEGIIEGPDPGRVALEALALAGYRSGALSKFQARTLLKMERLVFEDLLAAEVYTIFRMTQMRLRKTLRPCAV